MAFKEAKTVSDLNFCLPLDLSRLNNRRLRLVPFEVRRALISKQLILHGARSWFGEAASNEVSIIGNHFLPGLF